MTTDDLQDYAEAWNAHDIDKIMSYMSRDCIFETGGGAESFGTRFSGYEVVRQRFCDVWADLPDVSFNSPSHFIQGNRGCTQWTLTATRADGSIIEVDGCDLFTFDEDKISVKNSFMKNRA
ncbi:MAG: nuclear transport factor 2 family protein [Pseudomonadales bacterium]